MRVALLALILAGCPPTSQPADGGGCANPCGYFEDGAFGRCPAALPGHVCRNSCCVRPDFAGACATCVTDPDCSLDHCGKSGVCIGGACVFAP